MYPVLFRIPNLTTMPAELVVVEIVLAVASLLTWIALKLRGSEGWFAGIASTVAILLLLHLLLSWFMEKDQPITIYSFGVVIILGFLAGAFYLLRQTDRLGLDGQRVFDWAFWCLVVGIIGARLLYAYLNADQFRDDKLLVLKIWNGGLVWYGGLIPAAIVGTWLLTRFKLPVLHVTDAMSVGLMLALGIGRWACLLAGDDYGRPTDSWVGIRFYNPEALIPEALRGTADHAATPLHPTQLYMSVNCLWLFFILEWVRRRARFAGQTMAWMFILYALTRSLVIEPFRGDFVERNPGYAKHIATQIHLDKGADTPAVELTRGAVVEGGQRRGRLLDDLELPAGEAEGSVWVLSDEPVQPLRRGLVAAATRDDLAPPWPVQRVDGLPGGVEFRNDPSRWYRSDLPVPPGYVSTSQWISLFVVLAGLGLLLLCRKLNVPGYADAVEEAAT